MDIMDKRKIYAMNEWPQERMNECVMPPKFIFLLGMGFGSPQFLVSELKVLKDSIDNQ